MFESDGKKQLKSKYNKMKGIAQGDAGKSVYGELKLSEKLHQELDLVRDYVDRLREELEEVQYKNQ